MSLLDESLVERRTMPEPDVLRAVAGLSWRTVA